MSEAVNTGQWTDWSSGSILGARITISSQDAGYIIAFIAIFCGLVGSSAWKLVAYVVHQRQASDHPENAMHFQLQAALRNSSTHTAFVLNVLRIIHAWQSRPSSKSTIKRASSLVALATSVSLLFTAAGTLSSKIASSDTAALLQGQGCGFPRSSADGGLDNIAQTLTNNMLSGMTLTASNAYARECYTNFVSNNVSIVSQGPSTGAARCNNFVQPSLSYTVELGNPCPFEEACAVDDAEILQLDTGYLDSHEDLGLNQPLSNRVLFRRVTTCSPLNSEGFSDNTFTPVEGFEYLGNISTYAYGGNAYQPTRFAFTQPLPFANATFVYGTNEYLTAGTAYHMMIATTMQSSGNTPEYVPVTEISSDAARPISLIFLANRAFYASPVNDTWFNATQPLPRSAGGSEPSLYYLSPVPGSVLGCTEQAQICNPNAQYSAQNCTDLDSWYTWNGFQSYYNGVDVPALTAIGLNDVQKTTALMIQESLASASVWNIVDQLGDKALLASSYLSQQEFFWSPGLSDNQWQIEVANWFSIGLSQLQRFIISNYRKPIGVFPEGYWEAFPANATAAQLFCKSQKVHNAQYTTLSVLGLALTFGLGGLIILCSILVPYVVPKIQVKRATKKQRHSAARDQWKGDHFLQLQRIALQAHDSGSWEGEDDFVPITKSDGTFEPLPLLSSVRLKHKLGDELLLRDSEEGRSGSFVETQDTSKAPAFLMAEMRGVTED